MAPEPEVLKRKRSRPSDWWAAAPTTPQQQDERPAKKREGLSNANADGKGMKDAPAAGNRGKGAKGKEVVRDGENGEDDELQGKPVRRGRSSGGREELTGAGEGSRVAKKMEAKKAKITQGALEDQSAPKRRGRPSAVEVEEQAEESVVETLPAKKKGRPPVVVVGEPLQATERHSTSARRGRSSNTEAEVRAVAEAAIQADTPRKRGRRPAVEKQIEVEEADEDPIAPQKRRRPAKAAGDEPPVDELVAGIDPRVKKRRRSGLEILESEALALTTTENYAKGRPRASMAKPVVPSTDDHDRGRKRTRHSDAHVDNVASTASSTVDRQGRGPTLNNQFGAELQEAVMGKSFKRSKGGRQRSRRVEVEAASSKLRRNRSRERKVVKPDAEKRAKSAKVPSAIEQGPKSKKRTRSSIEGGPVEAVAEPSKTSRKVQAQEEARSRKRKDVEKHSNSQPVKRRRIEKPPQQDPETPEVEEAPMYQHLQAVTRRVSRQTIEAKWDPLPAGCVERISQLLQDLQRPVLVRYNDERKKTQSSTALQMISRRLVSKISKGLPFPQGTRNHREDDFDFEKILDLNRALEAQLTPALHANELLEAQVTKEMAWLESEQERLATLEANAKTEASLRTEASRKLHTLLQPQEGVMEVERMTDGIGLSIAQVPRPLGLSIEGDEQLQDIVQDLHGHVDSIQGNIRQVHGIVQAISNSKAAVQATLFGHLDRVQYDEVVLGIE